MSEVAKMSAPKPFIELNGKYIAPYLYGDALRILGKNKNGLTADELRSIHRQVSQQGTGASLFGVRLSVITDPACLKPGCKLLLVDGNGMKTIYAVQEVTGAGGVVRTVTELPKHSAGFKGFFRAENALIPVRDYDLSMNGIYFLYEETEESCKRERKPNFLERVMEMASQFGVLVECWAIAHAQEGEFKDSLSHDAYLLYWADKFRNMYGRRFEHVSVAQILVDVACTASLSGINRIYDDRNRDWLNRPLVDKVTPLLEQMQADILVRLLDDAGLFDRIFPEHASIYWKRRLQVIVEQFNAPKEVEVSNKKAGPIKPRVPLAENKRRRLRSIIHIIERPDTEEGLRACAHAVYERIMGCPYTG